jgi:hypothetical protein
MIDSLSGALRILRHYETMAKRRIDSDTIAKTRIDRGLIAKHARGPSSVDLAADAASAERVVARL